MEPRKSNRSNTWIIIVVVVVVVLAILACAAIAVGAAFFLVRRSTTAPGVGVGIGRVSAQTQQTFTVGQAPTLTIENFAGPITINAGPAGQISVRVTKHAPNNAQLNRITANLNGQANGVDVRTSTTNTPVSNMSVDLEITVPPDTQVTLHTGAGNVQITNLQAALSANTGAGNVNVKGVTRSVTLQTGAGLITYGGTPQGQCSFSTGAGNINLSLPANANVQVDLTTGIGTIGLGGFNVAGSTSNTSVKGTIGTGDQATIEAHTAVGNISLSRQ